MAVADAAGPSGEVRVIERSDEPESRFAQQAQILEHAPASPVARVEAQTREKQEIETLDNQLSAHAVSFGEFGDDTIISIIRASTFNDIPSENW